MSLHPYMRATGRSEPTLLEACARQGFAWYAKTRLPSIAVLPTLISFDSLSLPPC